MKITIDSIKKTALLAGGLFLSVLSVNADDVQKSIDFNYLRTPEAAAFKKYGEESVNEYTGTADISVPLYTIKCKDIEIPLVLRYDASGIKVEQEASWVGLGWNLMVGGCINYVCAGGHDMYRAPNVDNKVWTEYLTSDFSKWNYAESTKTYVAHPGLTSQTLKQYDSWNYRSRTLYYTYDSKDKFNWMATRPLKGFVESYVDVFFNNGMKEYIDYGYGERDFYSVNVMGKSFMFFIDPFTLKVFNIGKAGEDFVVNPDYGTSYLKTGIGNQPDVEKWKITDSDGYIYYFTVGDKYLWDNLTNNKYTSCWYLTKIQSPIGETVEFEYDSITKPSREIMVESVKIPFVHDYGTPCCGEAADQIKLSSRSSILQSENSGMSVTSHYLKKIKTRNQTVTFVTSYDDECSGKRLNAIKVVSYDGNTIKNINFSYSSFEYDPQNIGGNYAPYDASIKSQNRLKLDNVKEIASGDTLTTSFSYNPKQLPSKRSYAQDYWGYYNGKTNKVGNKYTMIPTPQSFMSSFYTEALDEYKVGGANRNSDGYFMQAAILNKVVYPTGGYTTYEYEPNSCVVSRSESDSPGYDIVVQKDFYYSPNAQAGASPVYNPPHNFTLKEELDFTLSVECRGDAIEGKSFNVIIVGGASQKVIPVTYKDQTKKVVLQDKLPAGSYQLMIGAPSSGSNAYGISCFLYGDYKSNTSKTFTKTVGGLRVKRISNYDSDDNLLNYTEYEYGGGTLLNRIETIDFMRMFNGNPKPGNDSYWNISHYIDVYTITSGHPHMPAFFASCNPGIVGYSKVKKSKYDANGILEKSVVTSYKNLEPIKMRDPETGSNIDHYTTLNNGVILNQEIYNASGDIVATTINDYVVSLEDYYATNIVAKQKYINIPGGSSAPYYEYQDRYDKTGAFTSETVTSHAQPGAYDIMRYPYILSRVELAKTSTTEYCSNGKTILRTKDYSYNPVNHQVSQIDENTSLTNQIQRTKIKYTVDDSKHTSIVNNRHRLNGVVETQKILVENGKENRISTQRTDYNDGTFVFALPNSSSTSVGNAPLETRATYTYDGDCNVRSVKIDGKETVYIWSYNSQYPIAKIEGLSFEEILSAIGQIEDSQYPKEMPITERGRTEISKIMRETDTKKISTFITTIRKKVSELGGYITTYTYKPLVGITSETSPNGNTVYYEYDAFGRLKNVKDINYKTLKSYEYNYKK